MDTRLSPLRRLRVLLIEDHDPLRQAVALLLRMAGYEVVQAGDCAHARAEAEGAKEPFDAVVGDIGLPDGDGAALLGELKRLLACPTVALTGHESEEADRRCTNAGVDRRLPKPEGVSGLAEAIQSLCGRPGI